MKPAPFDYVRPRTIDEAVRALGSTPDAKIMAGGQTLGPMLNLRLARPELIVDITRIPELAGIQEEQDAVTIGATVTHAAIEDGRTPDPTHGFLRRVARGIAYRAVRTRGTIGGSLAHGDPAADWLSALTALGAEVAIAGGTKYRVPLIEFVRGAMLTVLDADEIVVGVRIPKFSPKARFGYHKICRRTGEFAEAIGVVAQDRERGVFSMVAGATGGKPILLAPSQLPDDRMISLEVVQSMLEAAQFSGDQYELTLHAVALKRAYDEAAAA